MQRLIAKYQWDTWGVSLAVLLLIGEGVAVVLGVFSIVIEGMSFAGWAALLGAAVLMSYVPLAVCKGKLPFATLTEYEKRRQHVKAILDVTIPSDWANKQIHMQDGSDDSILTSVGLAYCQGDDTLRVFCNRPWKPEIKKTILLAEMQLNEARHVIRGYPLSYAPGLMDGEDRDISSRV